jgi:hypothetical protein
MGFWNSPFRVVDLGSHRTPAKQVWGPDSTRKKWTATGDHVLKSCSRYRADQLTRARGPNLEHAGNSLSQMAAPAGRVFTVAVAAHPGSLVKLKTANPPEHEKHLVVFWTRAPKRSTILLRASGLMGSVQRASSKIISTGVERDIA